MEKELKYKGWLNIYEISDTTNTGVKINREIVTRKSGKKSDDSVSGLLFDKVKGVFYFVKQYRAGCREEDRYLLEAPAGTLENGEDPVECFKREAMEEVGFKIEEVKDLGNYYTSPGGSTERIFTYIGYGKRIAQGGGLEEENEDIEVLEIPKKDLSKLEIKDLKTKMLINSL
jgi:nudix-type nucleoside diphosphatase (YffH/AdpP family)